MKRLRLEKWPGHLCSARPVASTSTATTTSAASSVHKPATAPSRPISSLCASHPRLQAQAHSQSQSPLSSPLRRYQSTAASVRDIDAEVRKELEEAEEKKNAEEAERASPSSSKLTEAWRSSGQFPRSPFTPRRTPPIDPELGPIPTPLPRQALYSPKLAALHARLALSDKIPLQTLARTLIDASADEAPLFNNINLAFLGQTLISYHVSEMLMCRYPRLPMEIMHSAMKSYAGDKTLYYVAKAWGVESAAAPGPEVDPGLLQFSLDKERSFNTKWGFVRPGHVAHPMGRRGISSRVVLDDDFGETVHTNTNQRGSATNTAAHLPHERQLSLGDPDEKLSRTQNVHATFVRAVVGAIYTHSGREAARSFIKAHVLSRQLDLAKLFSFRFPQRELVRLCAREEFEPPVAKLLSETGRLSSSPVFVVGIFSGNDKLGEGAASSLVQGRQKASINALLAWYLYSPGEHVRVPSEMLQRGAKPWEPVYVDIGEVVSGGL